MGSSISGSLDSLRAECEIRSREDQENRRSERKGREGREDDGCRRWRGVWRREKRRTEDQEGRRSYHLGTTAVSCLMKLGLPCPFSALKKALTTMICRPVRRACRGSLVSHLALCIGVISLVHKVNLHVVMLPVYSVLRWCVDMKLPACQFRARK